MAMAVELFYGTVVGYITVVVSVATLAVEIAAFLHCLVQRAENFAVIGTLSKGLWLALIGGSLLFVLLAFGDPLSGALSIFGFLSITISLIYMLDVRPALRDAANGRGTW